MDTLYITLLIDVVHLIMALHRDGSLRKPYGKRLYRLYETKADALIKHINAS